MRLYAVMRADLEMPPGKLAAQAGHAFLDTWVLAQRCNPDRATEYLSDHGTKVVLRSESLEQLLRLHDAALAAGIPTALVIDSGHVLPPHFTGAPIVTALGIGPALRHEVHAITGALKLW